MRNLKVLIPLVAAAAAAATVAVPVAMGGGHPDPSFAALHRPARADDRLPASSGSGPLSAIDRDSARLVGSVDGQRLYMAPGPDDSVCVLAGGDGSLGGGCSGRRTIAHRPGYVAWRDGNANDATVVVLVPDQYETAEVGGRAVAVRDNVAVAHVPAGRRTPLELDGDHGALEGDLDLR
jgi:hypothetical protein